jgi:hypothetical protein
MSSLLTSSRGPSHRCRVRAGDTIEFAAYAVRGSLAWALRWTPLLVWFCATVVLMAALAVGHQFSLAALDRRGAQLSAGLAQILPEASGWTAIHVLYSECRCSQRIVDHLRASERPADLHELVMLVGDDREQALASGLTARGFTVASLSPDQLASRFGIEGAPTFALVDPTRTVRYLGGYTLRQQGPDIRDRAIVRAIRAGDDVADLPVFGCAVSRRLRAFFDPFSVRR